MGATEELARFVVETETGAIPAEALERAKEAFLDGLGVTIAGAREAAGRIITDYVKGLGAAPEAGVVGSGFKTSLPEAALANGTLAHALDYDDVIEGMMGHPTAPVLPVVLALGEACHAPGREVLAAYVMGVEVEAQLGLALGRADVPLNERGVWQAQRLADALAAHNLKAIYSSPLSRALDSAQIIAQRHGLAVPLLTR